MIKQWHVPTKKDLENRCKCRDYWADSAIRSAKITSTNKKLSDYCLVCEKEQKMEDKLICKLCFEKYHND